MRPVLTLGRFLRRHWLITLLVGGGVALRVLAIVAYRPAILYVDSVWIYLNHLPGSTLPYAATPSPDPLGYNMLMLQPLLSVGNLFTVVLVQHVLGISMAILIYAVLVRRGAWRWLSAVAAAPVLLDGYQVYIEHMIMSDSLFQALLVERSPHSPGTGGRDLDRDRRRRPGRGNHGSRRRRTASRDLPRLCAVRDAEVVVQGGRHRSPHTELCDPGSRIRAIHVHLVTRDFAANTTTATSLYARAATFVDCSTLKAPAEVKQLCPVEPLGSRRSPDFYAHTPLSPVFHAKVPPGMTLQQLETRFAKAAMTQQPLRLTGAVLHDAARLFTRNHDGQSRCPGRAVALPALVPGVSDRRLPVHRRAGRC